MELLGLSSEVRIVPLSPSVSGTREDSDSESPIVYIWANPCIRIT